MFFCFVAYLPKYDCSTRYTLKCIHRPGKSHFLYQNILTRMCLQIDNGYNIAVLLLTANIFQYFMMTLLLKITLDVMSVQFHDVYSFIVFENVNSSEIFIFDALDEVQLFLNLLVSIPHLTVIIYQTLCGKTIFHQTVCETLEAVVMKPWKFVSIQLDGIKQINRWDESDGELHKWNILKGGTSRFFKMGVTLSVKDVFC